MSRLDCNSALSTPVHNTSAIHFLLSGERRKSWNTQLGL
jgi:hypothetical protein